MAISLANLSDADLGAVVRRALAADVIAAAKAEAPAKAKAKSKEAKKREKLAAREAAVRERLEVAEGFTLLEVAFPDLSITEEGWDEQVTTNTLLHYLVMLYRTLGEPATWLEEFDPTEPPTFTWRMAWHVHGFLAGLARRAGAVQAATGFDSARAFLAAQRGYIEGQTVQALLTEATRITPGG